ncbi:hypothetical protein ACFSC3_13505 [Sphingomonas floccifaciens]|uniref:Uncharacterized protein n=1 Tax=Sphingomonas floccifaciens TaxID=1844115 RepID=A0ABW4NEL1_9SPHN
MKSLASLFLILAAPSVAQGPVVAQGSRGSLRIAADVVGRADVGQIPGMFVVARGFAAGGYAKVTALDSGRTVVVAVADGEAAPGMVAMLSADAAAALDGVTAGFRVRLSPYRAPPPVTPQPSSNSADAPA